MKFILYTRIQNFDKKIDKKKFWPQKSFDQDKKVSTKKEYSKIVTRRCTPPSASRGSGSGPERRLSWVQRFKSWTLYSVDSIILEIFLPKMDKKATLKILHTYI
jgi:hypothetical protein